MKICFYCDSIFSVGGVQRVLAVVARGLSLHHEVTVLTADDPEREDRRMYGLDTTDIRFRYVRYPRLPAWEYYPCKAYSLLYKKLLPQNALTCRGYAYSSFPGTYRRILLRALSEEEYDVIVGVHVYPCFYLSAVKKHLQAKVVGWLHTSFDAFFRMPGVWLWKSEKRFVWQMKRLDRRVVLTHYDQQLYRQQMGLSCEVIYNPLTLEAEGTGSPAHKRFLAVGRMSRQTKGFDILIRAFARFARQEKEWTLEIVGEGPEEEELKALVAGLQLEDRVFIRPFTAEISRHYRQASVFVLSSRWEGFPLVLAEAMAHGLPLVASDLPVVREWLQGEENVLTFRNGEVEDLAEQLLRMSQRKDLAALGQRSVELAARLALPVILEKWERLFSEMFHHTVADSENDGHKKIVEPEQTL